MACNTASASSTPNPFNPYAGKSYGGCENNFCPSKDDAVEQEFWHAAERGDAAAVKQLLANDKLNISRNVVPDDDGMTRVLDVAVWTASEKGRHEVMKVCVPAAALHQFLCGHRSCNV